MYTLTESNRNRNLCCVPQRECAYTLPLCKHNIRAQWTIAEDQFLANIEALPLPLDLVPRLLGEFYFYRK